MNEQWIRQENIVFNLNATSKEDVFRYASDQLKSNGYLRGGDQFYEALIDRESQVSTGIGNGFAIPHGLSDTVIQSTAYVMVLSQAIDWGSIDDQPVKYVILMAIEDDKEAKNNLHLKNLARLAEKMVDKNFLAKIKSAQNEIDLYHALID